MTEPVATSPGVNRVVEYPAIRVGTAGSRVYTGASRVYAGETRVNTFSQRAGSVVRETIVRDPQIVQVQGEVKRRTKVVEVPVVHHRVEVPGLNSKFTSVYFDFFLKNSGGGGTCRSAL